MRNEWLTIMGFLAAASCILLSACQSRQAEPQITIRLGLLGAIEELPHCVAKERGFDKKNGLRVEEVSYQGGSAMIDALATGSLDAAYSIGAVPALAAVARGVAPGTVVAVAANAFSDPEHPLVGVLAGRSITGWRDLQGQAIGVNAAKSMSAIPLEIRLRREGIRGYRFVPITFANMGLAVAGGNVAAAAMLEPWLTQSLLRGDGTLLGWVVGGPPFERMQVTSIVFRAQLMRENPRVVKAFLRGHLDAVKWIGQNAVEARTILSKCLTLTKEVGQKVHLLRWPQDARMDAHSLEETQRSLVEMGVLERQGSIRQLFDETLLEQVLTERR